MNQNILNMTARIPIFKILKYLNFMNIGCFMIDQNMVNLAYKL